MSGPRAHDRVRETSTTTGTGTLTLAGAVAGFRSFAAVGDGNACCFCVENGSDWEVSVGVYTASGTTLTRAEVLASSNSGSAVNFGSGTKQVFLVHPGVHCEEHLTPPPPGGRLTLTSGTPVTSADVTGATTIYYSPFVTNRLDLWDSRRWAQWEFPEFGLALGTLTSGKPYDVFCFKGTATPSSTNTTTEIVTFGSATGWQTGAVVYVLTTGGGLTAGTTYWWNAASSTTGSFHTTLADALAASNKVNLTASITSSLTAYSLESLVWTNDTTRATAITVQDGRYCKSGDKTRLYLGTFYTTSTTATADADATRYLVNLYNAVPRRLFCSPGYTDDNASTSFTHAGTTWSEVNGGTNSRVSFLVPIDGLVVDAAALWGAGGSATGPLQVGQGYDSTTSAYCVAQAGTSTNELGVTTLYRAPCAAGKHFLAMLGVNPLGGTGTIFVDSARLGSSADTRYCFTHGFVWG